MWAGTHVPGDSACCADLPPWLGQGGGLHVLCHRGLPGGWRHTLSSRGTGRRVQGSRGAGGRRDLPEGNPA